MIFRNVNQAYVYFIKLLKYAPESKPRGMKIKEVLGISFTIQNPRDRITANCVRTMSLSFAYGELLWYLRGNDRLDIIKYYSNIYSTFSDDNNTVNGAYGKRIFGGKQSQWEQVKKILLKDPDSRQAIISIYQPKDLFICSRDIPCTCTIQYFIRNGKLNAITYMRSNDIYLGMPYDIFSFTMLQEMMAVELNVEMGTYTHMVGSLHIYEKNYEILEMYDEKYSCTENNMQKMTKDSVSKEQIQLLLNLEESFRENRKVDDIAGVDKYWNDLVRILEKKCHRVYFLKE